MSRAWYMLNEFTDQQLENHLDPTQFVDMEVVNAETGILLSKVNLDTDVEWKKTMLKHSADFTYEMHSDRDTPGYNDFMRKSFIERDYPGFRLVMKGSGYVDVKDGSNRWIRIEMNMGHCIVIPEGTSHRFTGIDCNVIASSDVDPQLRSLL